MSADEPDELIGALVDERYKVLEAMASGSMGAVYKAERVPVGKLVAIKFLHASYANDKEFLLRFERETRVMSKLAHPNCVSVLDFGVFQGSPYLVMEHVAGATLRAVLDDGALKPRRALRVVRQIAAGLAHAHAQGIVHRDVKPANIMITEEIGSGEHARILDFGLARLRGAVGRDATQANVVVGTPNYMAPEQTVGGGTIDARTDIYAVGVVLFEMITGDRPFQAEDTHVLLGMHRGAPIPNLAERVEAGVVLPEGLQALVEKAMAKSPDDRFQSAIELAEAIDQVSGARRASGDTIQPPSRKASDPDAIAPVLVAAARGSAPRASTVEPRSGGMARAALALLVLGGGGAAAAWYVRGLDGDPVPAAPLPQGSSSLVAGSASPAAGSAITPPVTPDASEVVAVSDAPIADAEAAAAGLAPDPGLDATAGFEPTSGSGAPPGAGQGSGELDVAPDPVTAESPVPPKVAPTDDEAADAPSTAEDVEKRAPKPRVLATTVEGALQQIKEGNADLAIASLRALWRTSSASAYIPFLLGNLYYDKLWWSVAIDHYQIAITKNGGYRGNPTLNRNVIRMLAGRTTSGKADSFLRKTIGKPAVPYLKVAAKYDSNPLVKRRAASLAKALGGR